MKLLALVAVLFCGLAPGSAWAQSNEINSNSDRFETVLSTPKVDFRISLSPTHAKPGEEVVLTINAQVAQGWHIGAIANSDRPSAGLPTAIDFSPKGIKASSEHFTSTVEPRKFDSGDETQWVHVDDFSWQRKYQVRRNRRSYSGNGSITFQVCNDEKCLPPKTIAFDLKQPPRVMVTLAKRSNVSGFSLLGEPIVVNLEDCDLVRPEVRFGAGTLLGALATGNKSQDKLILKGSLKVQEKLVSIYLPEDENYSIDNKAIGETSFDNTSTYLSIDQNGDGQFTEIEAFACNRPVRVLDTMFLVNEFDIDKKSLTLQRVDAPLSGSVIGRKCPEFEFKTLTGETISDKSILGTATILDIWAVT